ncbi:hypothetical protein CCR75_008936 [Bremia lactucae]|uniref:Uncharacterized protein n=1 Tax=Bremia lactucae TaxID=4779 RepID=A0A976P009_BRELC|nr:hypothetical protein CCR75_008936 [Bremia lactucae]
MVCHHELPEVKSLDSKLVWYIQILVCHHGLPGVNSVDSKLVWYILILLCHHGLHGVPIIAAFARVGRQAEEAGNQDFIINNSRDANGAGSSNGGMDGRYIEGGAAVVGIESNLCSKRLLPKVSTINKRVKVTSWLVEDANQNGEKGVILRTINQFPSEFRSKYNYLGACLICVNYYPRRPIAPNVCVGESPVLRWMN